jgi:hypothetical protein
MATLLSIASDAADEIGIPRPSSIIGSTDQTARRLLALSNREGRSLAEEADWTVLQRLHTFDTVISQEEYDLPSDYNHLLRDSEWDREEQRPLIGPLTPQQWQSIKSGSLGTGLAFRRYRIVRSASSTARTFRVEPVPTVAGETLAFEYISDQWCSNAAADTTYDEWNADTDVTLLDEDLMILGLVVRFKRSTGLDFASEADEYARMLTRKKGQDRPSPTLNMAHSSRLRLISPLNLPETGYGQ